MEVINGATEGYFTAQNAIRLQEYLDAYHPDLVAFELSASGGIYSDASLESVIEYQNGVPKALHSDPLRYFPQSVAARISQDQNMVRKLATMEEFRSRAAATWSAHLAGGLHGQDQEAVSRSFLRSTVRLLTYMREASRRAKAEFVVLQDANDQATTKYNVPPNLDFGLAVKLEKFVKQLLVGSLQIAKIFSEAGIATGAIFRPNGYEHTLPGDYHFNELGAQVVAESIANGLGPFLRNAPGAPAASGKGKGKKR